jgi:hypothetical protein
MDAAQQRKLAIIQTLQAQAETIYTRFSDGCQIYVVDRARVGFKRHLGCLVHGEMRVDDGKHLVNLSGREQAGSATAEVNAAHSLVSGSQEQLLIKCFDILRDVGLAALVRYEGAVATPAAAKGKVNVKSDVLAHKISAFSSAIAHRLKLP